MWGIGQTTQLYRWGGRFVRISKKAWVAADTKLDEHNAVMSAGVSQIVLCRKSLCTMSFHQTSVYWRVLYVMFTTQQYLEPFHPYGERCSAHGISREKCYFRPMLPYALTLLVKIRSPCVTNDMWPTNALCSPLIKMAWIWKIGVHASLLPHSPLTQLNWKHVASKLNAKKDAIALGMDFHAYLYANVSHETVAKKTVCW